MIALNRAVKKDIMIYERIKKILLDEKKMNNFALFLFLLTMVMPKIRVITYEMPVTYLLMPLLGIAVIYFNYKSRQTIPISNSMKHTLIAILAEILISSIIASLKYFGYLTIPVDVVQYLARFITLTFFVWASYNNKVDIDNFIRYFLIILIIGMVIGLLQWLPWPGRVFFIKLYPFRDGMQQLSMLDRPIHRVRIHGFAQHGTAIGGVASFAIIFATSIIIYYRKYIKLSVFLIVVSFVTILFSQGRAGQLAFVFSIFLFFLIHMKYVGSYLKPILTLVLVLVLLTTVVTVLYFTGNEFTVSIINKWIRLFSEGGGGRIQEQFVYFSNKLNGTDWIFGLSRKVISKSYISYGVEIEPINIFITYGLMGLMLQYGLIIGLLIYFYRRISSNIVDPAILTLLVASFITLFSYQVFSVGFYFFREIQVGLFPWLLMGITMGSYKKYRRSTTKL